MSGSVDAKAKVEIFRRVIRSTVTPQNVRYHRRNVLQRAVCSQIGIRWSPQWTPYINAAMTLEGFQMVIRDGLKYYKHPTYTNPSASE